MCIGAPEANNAADCSAGGGSWQSYSHNKPDLDCVEAPWSRDNHLGNVDSSGAFAVIPALVTRVLCLMGLSRLSAGNDALHLDYP